MSTLKRTLALLSALCIASVSFVGCDKDEKSSSGSSASGTTSGTSASGTDASSDPGSSDDSSEPTKLELSTDKLTYNAAEDGTLTILTWNDDDAPFMIDQYKASSGCTNVEYVKEGTSGGEASTKFDPYLLGGNEVDVFFAEADWILQYANDKYAQPLANVGITVDDLKGCYDYTVAIGMSGSDLYAASWQACAGGFTYNRGLAEEYLGVTTPEELQAKMNTWDTFKATAKELDENSSGAVDICASLGGLWQVYATNRSAAWVTADNKLNVGEAANFVTFAKELVDAGYVDPTINQWNEAWWAAGANQKCLGFFGSTWCLKVKGGQLAGWSGATVEEDGTISAQPTGEWGLIEGPQAFCWGGTWLCVAKQCNNPNQAGDFIKMMTTNEAEMYKYATTVGDFVNNENVMNYLVQEGTNKNGLLGDQDHFAVLAANAAKINLDGLITNKDAKIKSEFLTAVTNYLKGDASEWEETFQDKIAEIYPDELVWD